jgi:ribonuclease Y
MLQEMLRAVSSNLVGFVILFAVLIGVGFVVSLAFSSFVRGSARRKAGDFIRHGQAEVERLKKEADIAIKAEQLKAHEAFEAETAETRQELRQLERRLSKREDSIDRKSDLISKKEKDLDRLEKEVSERETRLQEGEAELSKMMEQERQKLHEVSGLSQEQATEMLMQRLEVQMQHECDAIISKYVEKAREESERRARDIVATAVQRCAVDHSTDLVVSTIDLPSDEMKGRIIGREGRNIRAFEKATGIDVIVDDTPGLIVVSGFDSVRRETARLAMQRLIQDGRIHPARIEEVVDKARVEVEQTIEETGKQTCLDMDLPGLHPKEVTLIGRLRYRTSYGQSVLKHSIEVAHLAAMMASELGLDALIAKRAGLLHDIGKAVDHEVEGSHAALGADLARRYGERPEIINAIAAHHEEAEPESVYAVLVLVADAISASRPGARRESLEKYIKRLERLEDVAKSFQGVDSAYAIQAGREVRVIVKPDRVSDKEAPRLCREIADEIEKELTYPGEITVTLIRETRIVERAR